MKEYEYMTTKNEYKMCVKSILIYRIRIIIVAVICAFLCGMLIAFFPLPAFVISILIGIILIVIFFPYCSMLYKSCRIYISDKQIRIEKGVIFLQMYCTSVDNIIYIGKITTPLQRIFKIFTICLYTKSGKIYIPNINFIPDIFYIRGFLSE